MLVIFGKRHGRDVLGGVKGKNFFEQGRIHAHLPALSNGQRAAGAHGAQLDGVLRRIFPQSAAAAFHRKAGAAAVIQAQARVARRHGRARIGVRHGAQQGAVCGIDGKLVVCQHDKPAAQRLCVLQALCAHGEGKFLPFAEQCAQRVKLIAQHAGRGAVQPGEIGQHCGQKHHTCTQPAQAAHAFFVAYLRKARHVALHALALCAAARRALRAVWGLLRWAKRPPLYRRHAHASFLRPQGGRCCAASAAVVHAV